MDLHQARKGLGHLREDGFRYELGVFPFACEIKGAQIVGAKASGG